MREILRLTVTGDGAKVVVSIEWAEDVPQMSRLYYALVAVRVLSEPMAPIGSTIPRPIPDFKPSEDGSPETLSKMVRENRLD